MNRESISTLTYIPTHSQLLTSHNPSHSPPKSLFAAAPDFAVSPCRLLCPFSLAVAALLSCLDSVRSSPALFPISAYKPIHVCVCCCCCCRFCHGMLMSTYTASLQYVLTLLLRNTIFASIERARPKKKKKKGVGIRKKTPQHNRISFYSLHWHIFYFCFFPTGCSKGGGRKGNPRRCVAPHSGYTFIAYKATQKEQKNITGTKRITHTLHRDSHAHRYAHR